MSKVYMVKIGLTLVVGLHGLMGNFSFCAKHDLKTNNTTTNYPPQSTDSGKTYQTGAVTSTNSDAPPFDATPNLKIKHDIFNEEQLETAYEFHEDVRIFKGNHTMADLGMIATTVSIHTVRFIELFMHRYDTLSDLKQSLGPHIDQEQCLRQLEQLNERAELFRKQKYESRDMNLYRLLDTYGRVQPGMNADSSSWTGMYDDCLRLRIDSPEGETPTRYCLASIRHRNWPRETTFQQLVAIEVGACLPKACDSLRYRNKYDLISKLVEFNGRQVDEGQARLERLYCLPDKDSPMRMWWRMPTVVMAIILVGIWIAFLFYATIKYEHLKRLKSVQLDSAEPMNRSQASQQSINIATGLKGQPELTPNVGLQIFSPDRSLKFYQMFAITSSLKFLFSTGKPSSLSATNNEKDDEIARREDSSATLEHAGERKQQHSGTEERRRRIVDLRCMDGIKVIAMFSFVLSHTLMTIANTATNQKFLTLFSPISMFSVNAFFTMTGILTCYQSFSRNQTQSFIGNPIKWTTLIIYRYFRIMPVYLVIVYYTKYLGKFTGSGPLWDYGTSSLAHRRQCEQESWARTLLFGANFKRLVENCNMSGWYVANDFQFFLVTPILLFALLKNPAFGKILLKFFMIAGWLAAVCKTLISDDEFDLRPLVKIMPHTIATHSVSMNEVYMEPQFRISAYLCGLLCGYNLYTYEQDKRLYHSARTNSVPLEGSQGISYRSKQQQLTTGWSRWFVNYGSKLSFIIIVSPTLPHALPQNSVVLSKFAGKLMAATSLPTYHLLYGVAFGFYILLASTGHGNSYLNNFLSAPIWKPFARLSLCVALVNIDVIFYMKEARKFHSHMEFMDQFAYNLLALFIAYLVALVLYILFEAPIAAALKNLLYGAVNKKQANI